MAQAVVFPIEVDLNRGTFTYDTTCQFNDGEDDDDDGDDLQTSACIDRVCHSDGLLIDTE